MIIADNRIFFRSGGAELIVQLLEGTYPNYSMVIPVNNPVVIPIDTGVFMRTARRVTLMTDKEVKELKLQINPAQATLTASNAEMYDAKERIPIDYWGDEVILGLNPKYLLDVLSVVQTEKVIIELTDAISPLLLREEESYAYKAVVMPVRTKTKKTEPAPVEAPEPVEA